MEITEFLPPPKSKGAKKRYTIGVSKELYEALSVLAAEHKVSLPKLLQAMHNMAVKHAEKGEKS